MLDVEILERSLTARVSHEQASWILYLALSSCTGVQIHGADLPIRGRLVRSQRMNEAV